MWLCGYVGLHKVQQILGVTRLTPVAQQSEGEVITVDGSRISQTERGEPIQTELYPIVWPISRKICMKMRTIGSLHIY